MYNKGELVWAKIRGYPWWPGIVSKIVEERTDSGEKRIELLVNFIGENSHSKLQIEKVAKYQAKYTEFTQNLKQKKLIDSVKTADEISSGRTTYDAEVKKLERRRRLKNKLNKKGGQSDKSGDSSSDAEGEEHRDKTREIENAEEEAKKAKEKQISRKNSDIVGIEEESPNDEANASKNPASSVVVNSVQQQPVATVSESKESERDVEEEEEDGEEENEDQEEEEDEEEPAQPSRRRKYTSRKRKRLTRNSQLLAPTKTISKRRTTRQRETDSVSQQSGSKRSAAAAAAATVLQSKETIIQPVSAIAVSATQLPVAVQQQQQQQVSLPPPPVAAVVQNPSSSPVISLPAAAASTVVASVQNSSNERVATLVASSSFQPNQNQIITNSSNSTASTNFQTLAAPLAQATVLAANTTPVHSNLNREVQSPAPMSINSNKHLRFQNDLKEALKKAENGQLGDVFSIDNELNTLLASLINHQLHDQQIENALNHIIAKIHTSCPSPENIKTILANNNGQSLMCVHQLLGEKKTLLENLNINVSVYLLELDSIVKMLQQKLVGCYFDHAERLKEMKQILKPQRQNKFKKEIQKLSNITRGNVVSSFAANNPVTVLSSSTAPAQNDEREMSDEEADNFARSNSFATQKQTPKSSQITLHQQQQQQQQQQQVQLQQHQQQQQQTLAAAVAASAAVSAIVASPLDQTPKKIARKTIESGRKLRSDKGKQGSCTSSVQGSNGYVNNTSIATPSLKAGNSPSTLLDTPLTATAKNELVQKNSSQSLQSQGQPRNRRDGLSSQQQPMLATASGNGALSAEQQLGGSTSQSNNTLNNKQLELKKAQSSTGITSALERQDSLMQENKAVKGSANTTAQPGSGNNSNKNSNCNNNNNKQVADPELRKKICKKMVKEVMDNYPQIQEQKTAQNIIIKLESKTRKLFPKMDQCYREQIVIVMRLIKSRVWSCEQLTQIAESQDPLDFNALNQLLQSAKAQAVLKPQSLQPCELNKNMSETSTRLTDNGEIIAIKQESVHLTLHSQQQQQQQHELSNQKQQQAPQLTNSAGLMQALDNEQSNSSTSGQCELEDAPKVVHAGTQELNGSIVPKIEEKMEEEVEELNVQEDENKHQKNLQQHQAELFEHANASAQKGGAHSQCAEAQSLSAQKDLLFCNNSTASSTSVKDNHNNNTNNNINNNNSSSNSNNNLSSTTSNNFSLLSNTNQ